MLCYIVMLHCYIVVDAIKFALCALLRCVVIALLLFSQSSPLMMFNDKSNTKSKSI